MRTLKAMTLAFAVLLMAAAAHATDWTVDNDKSRLGFSAVQAGNPFEGQFKSFDAKIKFDPDDLPGSKISVMVEIASFGTDDVQRDGGVSGAEWFDTSSFPQATFETTEIRPTGDKVYEMDGTLTLKGISKPVTIPFTLDITGDNAEAHGSFGLMRTLFNVGTGQWEADSAASHEVKVKIDIFATRAK